MKGRRLIIAPLVVTSLAVAACGGEGTPAQPAQAAQAPTVEIKAFQFMPDPVEVEAGTTITFVNRDATDHDVTSGPRDKPDGRFAEKLGPSGGKAQVAFDQPGTYAYYCSLHPGGGMEGEVVVR